MKESKCYHFSSLSSKWFIMTHRTFKGWYQGNMMKVIKTGVLYVWKSSRARLLPLMGNLICLYIKRRFWVEFQLTESCVCCLRMYALSLHLVSSSIFVYWPSSSLRWELYTYSKPNIKQQMLLLSCHILIHEKSSSLLNQHKHGKINSATWYIAYWCHT